MEKPNFFAILPANVRYDKRLKPMEKILYAEITSLASKEGYCFAKNSYFAELYEIHKNTVSTWINNLVECGYLKLEIVYFDNNKQIKERRLYVVFDVPNNKKVDTPINEKIDTYQSKDLGGINKKIDTPINKKVEDNNININNTRYNNKINNNNIPPIIPQGEDVLEDNQQRKEKREYVEKYPEKIDTVINYLNKKVKSNIGLKTLSVRKLINARVDDGYNVGDLMAVIDDKCREWLGSEKMRRYLVPSTLFRKSNFEKYIQQLAVMNKNDGYSHLMLDDNDEEYLGGIIWQ